MRKEISLEPRADVLIESLRSIGYTFQSAVADIIDNSLGAGANRISIYFNPIESYIAFIDNGSGMNQEELEEAMRFGSKDPLLKRDEKDLGRFGLGLKSASLSQCRKFTVCSKKNYEVRAYSWDLDKVRESGKWIVEQIETSEISQLPRFEEINILDNGTCVIWEKFDKIEETTESSKLIDTIEKLLEDTRKYLALIFHQYINDGVKIFINNQEIDEIDPFLTKSSFKQEFKVEPIRITDKEGNNHYIKVTPYVLPHFSSMTEQEKEMVGGFDSYNNKQGFYIYRNRRLIIWGTWFRIVPNNELFKNARVKVEIPNSLDYIWNVDVKKSSASIPPLIKTKLYHAVNEAITSSKNIYQKRARNVNKEYGYVCVWDSIKERNRTIYKINRELPSIQTLCSKLSDDENKMLDIILTDIENNLPKYDIYTKISEGKDDSSIEEKEELRKRMIEFLKLSNFSTIEEIKDFISILAKSEPYCNYKELPEIVLKEVKNGIR